MFSKFDISSQYIENVLVFLLKFAGYYYYVINHKNIFEKSPSVDDFVIVMMMVVVPVCRSGSERSPVVGAVSLGGPATEIGETEDSELVPEERAHGHVDEELEERVADAQPEDGEVEEWDGVDPVLGQVLVQGQADERQPRQPESHHQDEGHEVGRVGEVLAQGRRVLLVLLQQGAPHLAHGAEDVEIGVGHGGQGRTQDQDDQRHRVGRHARPVEVADEGLRVEVRSPAGVAGRALEQWRTAGQHGRQPREDDPALAARRRLHRFVAQRLADGQIAVHRYPHERVH